MASKKTSKKKKVNGGSGGREGIGAEQHQRRGDDAAGRGCLANGKRRWRQRNLSMTAACLQA